MPFVECRQCQCWRKTADAISRACVRYPPRNNTPDGEAALFIVTNAGDGCFEGIPCEVEPRHVGPPDPLDDVLFDTDLGGHGRIASGLRSGLHTRICDALGSENIDTVRDLIAWRAAKLIHIRNFGAACLNATIEFLARRGLVLTGETQPK